MLLASDLGAGSAQVISGDAVSSNSFVFDGIDLTEGLRKFSQYWNDLANNLPSFARVGRILNNVFNAFPPQFWMCAIIVVICLTLSRILRRF